MKIIYISSLISNSKMNDIIKNAKLKPLQSIQKFHRLICEGFVANGAKVKTISAIPMTRQIIKKTVWCDRKEIMNGVEYNYLPFINIKVIRQICLLLTTVCSIVKECFHSKKEKIFICDILNTTISFITVVLSKIFKYTCVGIITDLPEDINKRTKFSKYLENNCDMYILLTEQMNEKVNKKHKPYIVIEGLVDKNMELNKNLMNNKYDKKVCIYAGGLYEKYGVKTLIKVFEKINCSDAELHLYGSGDLEEYIEELDTDKVKYYGVVNNSKIVEEELKATLLINPRFTREEYTKYSFPSKNMEYMVSGTPILTTKLPGMPQEYYPYVYMFEDETEKGYKDKIEEILNIDEKELYEKGKRARKFVLENKNNVVQSKKIQYFLLKNIKR